MMWDTRPSLRPLALGLYIACRVVHLMRTRTRALAEFAPSAPDHEGVWPLDDPIEVFGITYDAETEHGAFTTLDTLEALDRSNFRLHATLVT